MSFVSTTAFSDVSVDISDRVFLPAFVLSSSFRIQMLSMVFAGIDAGLKILKTVILREDKIISHLLLPIGRDSVTVAAERALGEATAAASVPPSELRHIVVTGAGRHQIPYAKEQLPESLCLAKGIDYLNSSFAGIVLDIGVHKVLAVRCRSGIPLSIARSDRCAAAAGEYLEIVAEMLGIGMAEMGALYRRSREPAEIQSTCAVFAESEIISLLHQRKRPEDILKGALKGFAARIYPMLLNVGYPSDVALVGGVARNTGVIKAIEEQIGHSVLVTDNPDIVGALGAALIGKERMRSAE
jgi:predicted CoA-substrate-specific enzyme activase